MLKVVEEQKVRWGKLRNERETTTGRPWSKPLSPYLLLCCFSVPGLPKGCCLDQSGTAEMTLPSSGLPQSGPPSLQWPQQPPHSLRSRAGLLPLLPLMSFWALLTRESRKYNFQALKLTSPEQNGAVRPLAIT